jgi:hypothetical protein
MIQPCSLDAIVVVLRKPELMHIYRFPSVRPFDLLLSALSLSTHARQLTHTYYVQTSVVMDQVTLIVTGSFNVLPNRTIVIERPTVDPACEFCRTRRGDLQANIVRQPYLSLPTLILTFQLPPTTLVTASSNPMARNTHFTRNSRSALVLA